MEKRESGREEERKSRGRSEAGVVGVVTWTFTDLELLALNNTYQQEIPLLTLRASLIEPNSSTLSYVKLAK